MTDECTEWVADVKDAATGEAFSVHRCSECRALVESDHAADHLHWHRTQMLREPPARYVTMTAETFAHLLNEETTK